MAAAEAHFRKLERMYAGAPVNRPFAPELSVSEGQATLVMDVRPDHYHAAGAAHGMICFKMLDDATFFAAQSLVRDVFILTADFQLHLLRPLTAGTVRAEGKVLHRSRRLIVAEGSLYDARGRLAARGTGTFMPGRTPLTPEMGYR